MSFSKTIKRFWTAIDDRATWAKLRLIGSSRLAQSTLAVPLLGYFLLFNSDVVDYLKLHTDFCKGSACGASWRLHFLYFGCFFFAIGAAVYGALCPSVIKVHRSASDYFESERTYFSSPANLKYLFNQIEILKNAPANDHFQLKVSIVERNAALNAEHTHAIADIMAEYYVLQNRTSRSFRINCFLAYCTGGLLLAVPTFLTFFQVLWRLTKNF